MKRLIRRAVIALENIEMQLRVLNQGREAFYREVVRFLEKATEDPFEGPSGAGATAQVADDER